MVDWFISMRRHRVSCVGVLVVVALVAGACGGSGPESTPTPELSVVVFSTQEAEAIPTQTPPKITPPSENSPSTPQTSAETAVTERPDNINPLTGLPVDDPALLQRRPFMVRLGNDPEARPQVALGEAEIVYEELVEWWVTRFTAVYLSRDPDTIAPVRSARLINLQLAPQYQAALANSGGSDPVRWELSQTDIINLDEFFVPDPYFYRPNEGWQTRLAFDAQAGRDYLADEGLESNVNLRGFVFSEQPDLNTFPPDVVSDATQVGIPYPALTSEAGWEYDDASGKYLRFTTDEPMMDADGDQISAANVIIYFAEHQETDIVEDSAGATSIRIIINGQGKAWVARDGKLLKGNWQTNGRETPLFTFDNGAPMPLKPGNSWVQVVPLDYAIDIDGALQRLAGSDPASTEETGEAAVADEEPPASPTPTLTPIGARPAATATPEGEE